MSARLSSVPAAVAALVLLAGCAPAPPPEDITAGGSAVSRVERSSSTITVDLATATTAATSKVAGRPDEVWAVVPAVYASLSIPFGIVDPTRRVFGNERFTVRRTLGEFRLSKLLSCGYGPGGNRADQYRVHLRVLTQIQPAGADSVSVQTAVSATAATVGGASTNEVRCASAGILEATIVERIRNRLAGDPAGPGR